MYPDSIKAKNFNQFYNGIEVTPKYKYNPNPTVYKKKLLLTRPGVKKRINEYRSLHGQSPLTLQDNSSVMPWDNNVLVNPMQQQLMQTQPLEATVAAEGGHLFKKGGQKLSVTNQRAGYAVNYFMNKGLSKVAAAGLVGNLMRESAGLDPTAENPYSHAYGLAQWLGPRKAELFRRYGRNPTFNQQLEYICSR